MRGRGTLFSFSVLAVGGFLCTGTYYIHTGVSGALFAMIGFGIGAAGLFHRALQQYLSAREEKERTQDEWVQQSVQHLTISLFNLFAALEKGMTERSQSLSSQLGALTEQQHTTAQQCEQLVKLAQDILKACESNGKQAEAGNQYLEQMAAAQVEQETLNRSWMELHQQLKKLYKATVRVADRIGDLEAPFKALGSPLSEALERVMKDIEQQNKAQQAAMEQYQAMTTKDMQMLERLVRAVK